jgi:hypothetical protein
MRVINRVQRLSCKGLQVTIDVPTKKEMQEKRLKQLQDKKGVKIVKVVISSNRCKAIHRLRSRSQKGIEWFHRWRIWNYLFK